jgi:hypothetical protein
MKVNVDAILEITLILQTILVLLVPKIAPLVKTVLVFAMSVNQRLPYYKEHAFVP